MRQGKVPMGLAVGLLVLAAGCGDRRGERHEGSRSRPAEATAPRPGATERAASAPGTDETSVPPAMAPTSRGEPATARGAATPRQAILNVAKAIDADDKQLFMDNIYCQDMQLANAAFTIAVATRSLTRDFEREYGKGRWGPFRDRRQAGLAEVAETVRIEERGDRATAVIPDQDTITVVVRRGEEWKVDLVEEITSTGENAMKDVKDRWGVVAVATRRAREKVGMGQYKDNPEKILDELVKDTQGPDRQPGNGPDAPPEENLPGRSDR
jgi:hypothetical protein